MGYILGAIFNPYFLFGLGLAIACCFHIVRTGQNTFWLWIVLMFQGLGVLVYFFVIIVPSLFEGPTARKLGATARETLDPHRDYREALKAVEDSPTVANRMRLAAAAAAQGRHEEAETLYLEAAQGVHAEDPSLQLGRAKALVELGRFDEALEVLRKLALQGEEGQTPQAVLATARALYGVGRPTDAEAQFKWASERMPGFEAIARYTAFLAETGRLTEAKANLEEIDRRIARLSGPFRREASHWRDLAAARLR